jgi:DNA-binding beta-propeller fold protein YncE
VVRPFSPDYWQSIPPRGGITMKFAKLGCSILMLGAFSLNTFAQEPTSAEPARPLVLTEAISLAGVQGRFDHFGYDHQNRLFVSALGNNTVEVIDISARVLVHTISGVPQPQGVVFSPETNKLFVGSSQGKLYIFDGTSFDLLKAIDFHGDVDNLRYDAARRRVYAGYGDDQAGAIGAVDATTNERVGKDFILGAHPESFQLETSGPYIYVNLPDLNQVASIKRDTGKIERWHLALDGNFPMALDEPDHRLFVVTHEPPRLVVLDTDSGRLISTFPCVQDSDDMYYDAARKRIYISGGEGYLSVFQQNGPDFYHLIAKVPSALGARTSGYFGKGRKGFDRFFLAVPGRANRGAEIWIYTVQE